MIADFGSFTITARPFTETNEVLGTLASAAPSLTGASSWYRRPGMSGSSSDLVASEAPFARSSGCPLALLFWIFTGCLPSAPPDYVLVDEVVTGGAVPRRFELPAEILEPGRHEHNFQVPGQAHRSISIYVPDEAEPGALVLFLHGAIPNAGKDDPGKQTRLLLNCLALPGLRRLDPVIIAPQNSHGRWWELGQTEHVLGLVVAARKRWPAASRRTVIAGYSNGAIGTWYFATLYPQYFAAAIPIASNDRVIGESPLPLYAIHGTKDELFPIQPIRDAISGIRARGTDVTFHEKYRGGHMKPCSYAAELRDAAEWLEQRVFVEAGRPAELPSPGATGSSVPKRPR